MIISYTALKRFFPGISLPAPQELFEQLTAMGLEGEAIDYVGEMLEGIVAARIESAVPIEGTSLKKLIVDAGAEMIQVLSAEPTVDNGDVVAFAAPGTIVGDLEVGVRTMAGQESHGMVVSRGEAGIGGDYSCAWRVDLAPGAEVSELEDDDALLDFGITPNRGDLFSHLGVAREVGILVGAQPAIPELAPVPEDDGNVCVDLQDPDCPFYLAIELELGDAPQGVPAHVEQLVGRCGMRCIHPLVDLSNYVMLELGQPTHAFDADKIKGTVVVRRADPDEILATLDGEQRKMVGGELIIADDDGPIALAGVMGGARTEVDHSTRRVLLESAFFDPARVARGRRPHGLSTEASMRFERGVDVHGAERAASRILEILGQMADFRVTGVHRAGELPTRQTVQWDQDRAARLLGALPPDTEIQAWFDALGFVESGNGAYTVPPWRFDMREVVDLAEEVARLWGYDRFAPQLPTVQMAVVPRGAGQHFRDRVLDVLVDLGYTQVIHYSFTADGDERSLEIANPMGEQTRYLRRELSAGLIAAAARNHRHQQVDLRLAEVGRVFRAAGTRSEEHWRLGMLCSGAANPVAWQERRDVDFYDIKGDLENLLRRLGIADVRWQPQEGSEPWHPVRFGVFYVNDREAGWVGELEPAAADGMDVKASTVVGECRLDVVFDECQRLTVPVWQTVPSHPAAERDAAFVLDATVTAAEILAAVGEAAGPNLEDAHVFDVYSGTGIENGKRSVAVRMRFRSPTGTLSQADLDQSLQDVIAAVTSGYGATLR